MINVNQHPFETQKIITAELYKGSLIEKAYQGGDEGLISAEIIRKQLDNKLEKGIIDQELHSKAIEQLEGLLEKASKGEGSRGGHVIGHTKSGKPVYQGKDQSTSKEYKDFTAQDHKDAAALHSEEAVSRNRLAGSVGGAQGSFHDAMYKHHKTAQENHFQASLKLEKQEHDEKNLSTDEKKILADQKKKQIEHHQDMHDFHKEMAAHASRYGDRSKASSDFMASTKQTIDEHSYAANHHKSEKERLEKEEKPSEGKYHGSSHPGGHLNPSQEKVQKRLGMI